MACLASQTAYETCAAAAAQGACASEEAAAQTACQADEVDGGSLTGTCSTPGGVIYEICGNGM
jgi:hypothetical protein